MKKKYLDILSGGLLIAFGLWGWFETSKWKESISSAGISVKAYPRAVFTALAICGAVIVIRTIIQMLGNSEEKKELLDKVKEFHLVKVFITLALMVGYIYAMKAFGFIIPTFVFLFADMLVFGERKWIKMLIVAAIGTAALWLFFVQFMHVRF